jgi:hypothetical protein
MTTAIAPTGAFVPMTKADLDAKRRLDGLVGTLKDGIDAARDIYLNWNTGDNFSRFCDHGEYGRFIRETLGYSLDLKDAIAIMPGASTRQIAAVAGVTHPAVIKAKHKETGGNQVTTSSSPTVLGSDGKTYPAKRVEVMVPASPGPVKATRTEKRLAAIGGKPIGKMGKIEVRDQVNLMEGSMKMLVPDATVPSAHQRVIDMLPTMKAWIALWEGVVAKP